MPNIDYEKIDELGELAVYIHSTPRWETAKLQKGISDFIQLAKELPDDSRAVLGMGAELLYQVVCYSDKADDPDEAELMLANCIDELSQLMP